MHIRKTKLRNRFVAALGLFLSLAAAPLFAQQTRKVLVSPEPEYPELARKMNLTGVVKVAVVVGANGDVKDVRVQGGHPVLVEAVEKTLKKWKYAPASTESTLQLEFKF